MKFLWKLLRLANAVHVGLYRLTSGRIGGTMREATVLLLTTTGRKTGKARTVPVMYFLDDDGNPVVTASKAGMPENPAWFENLKVNPRVTYQIGGERKTAQADIAPAELRDRLWAKLTTKYRGFLEYQKRTTRIIPMVTLRAATEQPDVRTPAVKRQREHSLETPTPPRRQ